VQVLTSVSDPDSIKSGTGLGIQENKNYSQKYKNYEISCFEVLDVLF
jgi:hypothetical protein